MVFISKDGNQDAFNRNFGDMPWKAVKYDNEVMRKSLEQRFGVMEIPYLVILSADGKQVSSNGINDMQSHKGDVIEAWDKQVEQNAAEAGNPGN